MPPTDPVLLVKTMLQGSWQPANNDGITPVVMDSGTEGTVADLTASRDVIFLMRGDPNTSQFVGALRDFETDDGFITLDLHTDYGSDPSDVVQIRRHMERLKAEARRCIMSFRKHPFEPPLVPDADVVFWLNFDGYLGAKLLDVSGLRRHATIKVGTSRVQGDFGWGRQTDGSDDYMEAPSFTLKWDATRGRTIAVRVRPYNVGDDSARASRSSGGDGFFEDALGNWVAKLEGTTLTSTTPVVYGDWVWLVLVEETDRTMRFYVNAVEVLNQALGPTTGTAAIWRFGVNDAANLYAKADYDEFLAWERALTVTEVKALGGPFSYDWLWVDGLQNYMEEPNGFAARGRVTLRRAWRAIEV